MSNRVSLLIVGGERRFAEGFIPGLQKGGYDPHFEHVTTAGSLKRAVKARSWDLVLCQSALEGLDGQDLVQVVKEQDRELAVIFTPPASGQASNLRLPRPATDFPVVISHSAQLVQAVDLELREAIVRRQHREAIRALRESESKYRALFEGLGEAAFLVDTATGVILDTNAAAERLALRPKSQLVGACHCRLYPPDKAEAYGRRFFSSERHGGTVEYEAEIQTLDGTRAQVHVRATRVRAGSRDWVMGLFRDIPPKAQMRNAMRRREAYYHALLEQGHDVISVLSGEGTWRFVSPSVERVLGYRPDQLIGTSAYALVHPEDVATLKERWRSGLRAPGASAAAEFRWRHRDGTWVWVEAVARNRMEDPEVRGIVVNSRDVTKRKQFEVELERLALDRLLLLESTGEGIFGVDEAGLCTFVNQAGARLLGYAPEDLSGKPVHPWIHHHYPGGTSYLEQECPILKTARTGQPQRVEKEVFWRADGSAFPVEYSSHPIIDKGVLKGAVVAFVDLTEKRQLEAQFLRTQRLEGIGTLASGIAHDLNNILTPILMATQVAKGRSMDEGLSALIETIRSSAERGASVVKQVLTFARGMDGERILLQPAYLVKDCAKIARETFPRSIHLDLRIRQVLWSIFADPTQIHQVLLNLCINARDAMPQGGLLRLAAYNAILNQNLAGTPASQPHGPHVVIEVEDSGMGIPEHVLDRIFDPFFTTKATGKGTGLGLSTVMGIVKSHNGFVQVLSKVGQGTTFKIHLPATPVAGSARIQTGQSASARGQGESVLVVDDEAPIQELLREVLIQAGYDVQVASNGPTALYLMSQRSGRVQIAITDINMPYMDGIELGRQLRQANPKIKLIAISGLPRNELPFDADHAPFDIVLGKPISVAELLETTAQLLGRMN